MQGDAIYEFFNQGGVHNIMKLLAWLFKVAEIISSKDHQQLTILFFRKLCSLTMKIVQTWFRMDSQAQDILNMVQVTNSYETIGHFMQNFFYTILETLFKSGINTIQIGIINPHLKTIV